MDDDQKVRIAAACIAGADQPPDRLIAMVRHAGGPIRANYEIRESFPKRSDQGKVLDDVREAAALLAELFTVRGVADIPLPHSSEKAVEIARLKSLEAKGIEKQSIIALLESSGLNLTAFNMLATALPKLAAAAAAAPYPDKGRGKAKQFPNPDALTPQEQCAAVVSYGWRHVRGKPAPHTSEEAHRACDAVWQAAGLPGKHQWGDKSTGWRPVLHRCNDLTTGKVCDNGSFQIFLNLLDSVQAA